MSHHRPSTSSESAPEISLSPKDGWHCSHLYYRFNRHRLASFSSADVSTGKSQLEEILDAEASEAPQRLQVSVVSGHKADFGLMLMDPDPLKIDAVSQKIASSRLGPSIEPGYSFVSVTEVSEYVPSVEQYAKRLISEGEKKDSGSYEAKVAAYRKREPMMRRQRLTPDFPPWPATCFYPMNKKREVGENWFSLPFSQRNQLMAEHAKSGMLFAGKVSQLISVGVGLDDWEWGVTLWARNPGFLTEIVYRMRFDEASARYAEFGPFYTSYITSPSEMLEHCQISDS